MQTQFSHTAVAQMLRVSCRHAAFRLSIRTQGKLVQRRTMLQQRNHVIVVRLFVKFQYQNSQLLPNCEQRKQICRNSERRLEASHVPTQCASLHLVFKALECSRRWLRKPKQVLNTTSWAA